MFNIDLTLKNTPFPVSVQRKVTEDAEAVYQQLLQAMRSGSTEVIELTCEGQTEKKVAVRASDISSIQMSQKTGAAASGRPPGFFALAE
ncbi:hypothetical protein [Chroogloeocystis siderophila]|jgi:hypothetical protein|uniref:UPF0367 protein NIES1031_18045 n=1 Tax=Chroogloeocystis siderophila 5.2 s.c.1 TaxID=247279 RepID=A0A1U7HII4_9CHRO|nr:hypothetical protein [Chroogloeocystis siderophila]OKH23355.1 hypothetical protein NIES1031_18045 [Chroogloeocystis siderophila 5.2 s.c.1]